MSDDIDGRIAELRRLRAAATQSEWGAVKSSSGHDITAKLMQYSERQFVEDAHMYRLPQRKEIQWRLGEDGFLYASLAYETWRQFPSKDWDVLQEANAAFIAYAANHAVEIVDALESEMSRANSLMTRLTESLDASTARIAELEAEIQFMQENDKG